MKHNKACTWHTDTKNIEAKALEDGLVDKLIWETVKAYMASQGQVSGSIILRIKVQEQLNYFIYPKQKRKNFRLESSLFQHGFLLGMKNRCCLRTSV